jgi:sarcosine oxidase
MTYDVIVVGVGGMGSATAYHLARRGAKVLGLERFNIPHDLGSSHGVNRIIRLAYAEGSAYVPLLLRAYELWRELEQLASERLLFLTGSVDAGTATGARITGSLSSAKQHNITHELLDADGVNRRFPGYRLSPDMVAVYQPDGGFVLSERSIVAHVALAQDMGAEIHGREPVLSWTAAVDGVTVTTSRAQYQGKQLVITAGPWAAALIPELSERAIPQRQVMLWTQPTRPEHFGINTFPVFNIETPQGDFSGFPVHGTPGFKIGKYYHRNETIDDLDIMDRECHQEDEELLRASIRRYFPEADGPTMAMMTCIFTNSPDRHFFIDLHPVFPTVCFAAGFSGHGFKFCSVVGEIMADLALDGETRHKIEMFRLSRFALS